MQLILKSFFQNTQVRIFTKNNFIFIQSSARWMHSQIVGRSNQGINYGDFLYNAG